MGDSTKEDQQPTGDKQELKFEDALARLEKIVSQMEKGELSLQQMMQKFEEGMSLAKYCTNKLNETEKKIEVLMEKSQESAEEDQWQEIQDPETLTGESTETKQAGDAPES